MSFNKKTVKDIDVKGKRVLVRVDFNVPLTESLKVANDARIRAALPTIEYLLSQEAKVILVSHLGRPKGKVVDKFRLGPVALRLEELLQRPVIKVDEIVGPEVKEQAMKLEPGQIMLLENVRFNPGEEKNDPEFTEALASLAEIYVNDAFGTAHRAHSSTAGVAKFLPTVSGFLLDQEISLMGKAIANPEPPFIAIMGGAKIADKIGVMKNLLDKVDSLIIGGGMANTFLYAMGKEIGLSLCEKDKADVARSVLEEAKAKGVAIILPVDLVVAKKLAADVPCETVSVDAVPADKMALDIGEESQRIFAHALYQARTVIWNGPMGAFEVTPFDRGTAAVARAMAEVDGTTIIGGGDSVAAVEKAGVAERMSHISTGGGASLEFLEGRQLPGVAVLQDK